MARKPRSIPKWTIARRLVQFGILVLFISPVLLVKVEGESFFFGSLASSTFLGIVLSDPFAALQVMLASKKLNFAYFGGALLIFSFYLLIRGRVFCSWVCPVNTLLEFIDKIRKYINLPDKPLNRHTKMYAAAGILALSTIIGVPVFEVISPIGNTMRNVLFSFGIGVWILLSIVLFEVFISKRGWCRYLCPLGGFYQSVGRLGSFQVKFDHNKCMGCDRCRSVCFSEPTILEPGIFRDQENVSSGDCSLCGLCVDHCPFNALSITVKTPSEHIAAFKRQDSISNQKNLTGIS